MCLSFTLDHGGWECAFKAQAEVPVYLHRLWTETESDRRSVCSQAEASSSMKKTSSGCCVNPGSAASHRKGSQVVWQTNNSLGNPSPLLGWGAGGRQRNWTLLGRQGTEAGGRAGLFQDEPLVGCQLEELWLRAGVWQSWEQLLQAELFLVMQPWGRCPSLRGGGTAQHAARGGPQGEEPPPSSPWWSSSSAVPATTAGDVCLLLLSRVSLTPWLSTWLWTAAGLGALPTFAFFLSKMTASPSVMALWLSWRQAGWMGGAVRRTGWYHRDKLVSDSDVAKQVKSSPVTHGWVQGRIQNSAWSILSQYFPKLENHMLMLHHTLCLS